MDPSLANSMLARTLESIKHPEGHEEEVQATNSKMSVNTHIKLNTGASIPAVGLGTWQSAPGAAAAEHALQSRYRHIDAAFIYQNENEVGESLKKAFASGVKREDVFVTSTLWCTFHQTGLPEKCLDQTLKNLGLDYINLWLMH